MTDETTRLRAQPDTATDETTRLHRCAKCGDDRSAVESCEGDCYPLCGPCHDELRHEDAAVWRGRVDAAERERAEATARAERAEARVREMEAIIAGRTTPPTGAEISAHEAAGGSWLVAYEASHAPGEVFYRLPEDRGELDEWRVGGCLGVWQALRWIALGADGRPCAWPTAVHKDG